MAFRRVDCHCQSVDWQSIVTDNRPGTLGKIGKMPNIKNIEYIKKNKLVIVYGCLVVALFIRLSVGGGGIGWVGWCLF